MKPGAAWAIMVALALPAHRLAGQQYITDDAAITEYRACQIQLWHGERSSRVLPACTPVSNLEVSIGLIAVWEDGNGGHPEYVAQVKTLFRRVAPSDWGIGFVAGTGRDPGLRGVRASSRSVYAYVPVSAELAHDAVALHANGGWLYERRGGRGRNDFTWAARADLQPLSYGAFILEAFGTDHGPGEFQTGLRWHASAHIQLDLSYGGRIDSGKHGAGRTLGLTIVTPPFL